MQLLQRVHESPDTVLHYYHYDYILETFEELPEAHWSYRQSIIAQFGLKLNTQALLRSSDLNGILPIPCQV
jgi:hypothetical protein